jgi:hypothetical protein
MSLYKFNSNDVYVNTVKTYPSIKFVIYSGSSFYNNTPNISGSFTDPIRLTDSGHVSLYELNIDRVSSSTGRTIGSGSTIIDNGLIYPWVVKNGSRVAFRTTTTASFNADNYGDVIVSSYPLTSSIAKEYYSTTTARYTTPVGDSSGVLLDSGSVSHLRALKNTIDSYRYINPNFTYLPTGSVTRNLDSVEVGLVSIPTIFYGSQIKKGTVDLKFYYTGTLIAQAKDTYKDGMLYETYGDNTGSLIGFTLYNEGFVVLTASYDLSTNEDIYTGSLGRPKWVCFGQSISGSITAPSSSFIMEMSGTNNVQTLTMFALAPKGELNQSNNPTFVKYSTANFAATGSKTYLENDKMEIKNVVSSAYADPTGSFAKTTYISKVGIYDANRNLIGIAKVATPVKKTVERDFTFKIKLDL